MTNFKNDFVSVSFFEGTEGNGNRPYIIVRDLTDRWNEPTFYTRKIRGIEKAWAFLTQLFETEALKDDLNYDDLYRVLDDKFRLGLHSYCAMD